VERLPGLGCRAEGQRVEVGLIGCGAVKTRVWASAVSTQNAASIVIDMRLHQKPLPQAEATARSPWIARHVRLEASVCFRRSRACMVSAAFAEHSVPPVRQKETPRIVCSDFRPQLSVALQARHTKKCWPNGPAHLRISTANPGSRDLLATTSREGDKTAAGQDQSGQSRTDYRTRDRDRRERE
jgi:hypothetical protein